jgi:hypothetical protein
MVQMQNHAGLYEKIGAFLGQAVTGVQVGLFRAQGIPIEEQNMFKVACLANYLNGCWRSLIVNDDDYVTSTISSIINEHLPEESPLCLFHVFFHICQVLLNKSYDIEFSTPLEERTATNVAYVTVLRQILTSMYTAEAKTLAESYYDDRGNHECRGFKLSEIREQDPSPIWTFSTEAPDQS